MKKELSPLILLIVSIILTLILTPIGILHVTLKSIYETFQLKFWTGVIHFIKYWLKVLYQIWNVIKFIFIQLAIGIDLLGNVTTGEAIEDLVTTKEDTMYGNGEVTISTATGELEYFGNLNKLGVNFSKFLSKVLDPNHCIESYKRYIHNKKFEI